MQAPGRWKGTVSRRWPSSATSPFARTDRLVSSTAQGGTHEGLQDVARGRRLGGAPRRGRGDLVGGGLLARQDDPLRDGRRGRLPCRVRLQGLRGRRDLLPGAPLAGRPAGG